MQKYILTLYLTWTDVHNIKFNLSFTIYEQNMFYKCIDIFVMLNFERESIKTIDTKLIQIKHVIHLVDVVDRR